MPFDAAAQTLREGTSARRKPQAICPPVDATPSLDQVALLEGVHDTDHGRAFEAHGFSEPVLGDAGICLDQQHNAGAARRELANLRRKIPEDRLLGHAQPIANQLG